jgi:hypothetical protein
VNIEEIKAELKKLIEKRKTLDEKTSEADICANLVEPLFSLLGWNPLDIKQVDRQNYVRGAGYPDVALKIDNEPAIFVEVKRIGKIPKNRIDPQAQMTLPLKELADLIDRTPEEKQAFKYARSKEIPWAILTNFDCLYVFNADQERTILSFRTPEEYLVKFDDLILLSREKVKGKSLEWQQDQIKKEEIDKNFLEKLKNWRVSLAQNIYDENRDNHILKDEKGGFDFDQLMHIVQRILSRLLIIQIADDREVLRTHNILETSLKSFEDKGDYTKKDFLLKEFIDLSHMMDEHHNTTIFAPGHPCEKVFISNPIFARILRELCHISFRKMTADILGATYESYLGYRFSLKNGRIEAEVDQRVRKQAGIYYTPSYIVRYIVDNTLGVKLKELEDQHGLEAGEKAKDLKVLDPACGSGSFLIYAFDVLANFYERLNAKITEKQVELSKINSNSDMFERQEQFKLLPPRVGDYPKRILEDHLYGVDLDPAACEIATINLVIKAFEKMRDKKLPLILNQNVKVGNSLISGIEKKEDLEKFKDEIERHINLRTRLKKAEDDEEKRDLMRQIDQLREKVNLELNGSLKKYFAQPEEKRPFNWEFEFPEVFDSEKAEEQKGFNVVLGNPPYVRSRLIEDEERDYLSAHYKSAHRTYDIYIPFLERSYLVSKCKGLLSLIIPRSYLLQPYAKVNRVMLLQNCDLLSVADLYEMDVFLGVAVKNCIPVFRKGRIEPSGDHKVKVLSYVENKLNHPKTKFISQALFLLNPETMIRTEVTQQTLEISNKLSKESIDLGSIFYISKGVEVYVRGSGKTKEEFISFDKKIINPKRYIEGKELGRYKVNYAGRYLSYQPELHCSGKFPELFENPKIIVRNVSTNIFGTIDKDKLYVENTIVCCVPKYLLQSVKEFPTDQISLSKRYDPRFALALLNSKIFSFYFKTNISEKLHVYVGALDKLPIRHINFSDSSEKARHDQLVKYVDLMLERNKQKNEQVKIFEQVLKNHTHELQPFGRAYYEKPEYVGKMDKKAENIANLTDEVSKIFLEEKKNALIFSVQLESEKKEALRLRIDHENLRLFIFYSVRKYLEENKKRKKWTTKSFPKILDVLLGRLEVPIFKTRAKVYDPDHNLKMIDLVMKEFKTKFHKEFPKGNFHLSEIEKEIQDTDNSIDALVFKLYDLNKDEVTTVLDSMETPELIKKDILKKFQAMK